MRIAVIGSRKLRLDDLGQYLPDGVTEIVSGGAKGIDADARAYAQQHGVKLTEFLPEYDKYGRAAPLHRNVAIIERADLVLAFWDGSSPGTRFVIENCKKRGVPVNVIVLPKEQDRGRSFLSITDKRTVPGYEYGKSLGSAPAEPPVG